VNGDPAGTEYAGDRDGGEWAASLAAAVGCTVEEVRDAAARGDLVGLLRGQRPGPDSAASLDPDGDEIRSARVEAARGVAARQLAAGTAAATSTPRCPECSGSLPRGEMCRCGYCPPVTTGRQALAALAGRQAAP